MLNKIYAVVKTLTEKNSQVYPNQKSPLPYFGNLPQVWEPMI